MRGRVRLARKSRRLCRFEGRTQEAVVHDRLIHQKRTDIVGAMHARAHFGVLVGANRRHALDDDRIGNDVAVKQKLVESPRVPLKLVVVVEAFDQFVRFIHLGAAEFTEEIFRPFEHLLFGVIALRQRMPEKARQ